MLRIVSNLSWKLYAGERNSTRIVQSSNYKLKSLNSISKIATVYFLPNLVYSNQLKWVPQGNQQTKKLKVGLVHENILIAKLRENQ